MKRPPPPPAKIQPAAATSLAEREATKSPTPPDSAQGRSRRLVTALVLLLILLGGLGGGYVAWQQWSDRAVAVNSLTTQPLVDMPREIAPVPRDVPAANEDGESDPSSPIAADDTDAAPESDFDSPSHEAVSETGKPLGLVSAKTSEPEMESSTEPEPLGIVDGDAPTGLPAQPEEKGIVVEKPTGLPTQSEEKGIVAEKPAGLPAAPPAALPVVPAQPPAIFAERTKPKTVDLLTKLGGTTRSQAAVDDGLNWLARHQAYDGHWGSDCVGVGQGSRCEPQHACDGAGELYEAAQTGMALLAFQAGGHYYFNDQKYSKTVERGLRWLVQQQTQGWIVGSKNFEGGLRDLGLRGDRFHVHFMYEHAIATFALCDACAVALAEGHEPDPVYLNAATQAVRCLEQSQHADGGWRYTLDRSEVSDCSVSGWVMLALKTAQDAQIKVNDRVVGRMVSFFQRHRLRTRTIYKNSQLIGTDAMVGVGMLVDQFINHRPRSTLVAQGASLLSKKAAIPWGEPGAIREDYYLWYNCTLAMFQVGGPAWERWNDSLRDHVIEQQMHGEECERGSWPLDNQWSELGGRVYSTALAVLTLEVYYRFQRMEEPQVPDKRPRKTAPELDRNK